MPGTLGWLSSRGKGQWCCLGGMCGDTVQKRQTGSLVGPKAVEPTVTLFLRLFSIQ